MNTWDKSITLYNRCEDEQTGLVKWYRHKLNNCFYKRTDNKISVGGVLLQTDNTIIRIPAQTDYLPPYEWGELPNDIKSKKITLQSGDLIFLGDVSDEIDEYTSGKRSSDLITKYKALGSVFVKSVNINDFMYGRHYLVKGE